MHCQIISLLVMDYFSLEAWPPFQVKTGLFDLPR